MTTPNLAKIERVPDLRATWPNEAQHFTPWLADNIAELGEALGMDLELQQTEAPVGGYSLDILATDLNSNRPVIIENQLELTDHTHLGQLITYASGFDAGAVVWVTREFREEHRQALDWLNQRTGEDTQFFGVEVELWRIRDSLPAPHFRLAATPNGWRKAAGSQVAKDGRQITSARMERYRTFFQSLIDDLRENHSFTNARKGQPSSYYNFASGYSNIWYGASFSGYGQARVNLSIDFPDAAKNLELMKYLELDRSEIENVLGDSLEWDSLESRRACRVHLIRSGDIDDATETLSEIQTWMVENLLRFKEIFSPKLAGTTR